MDTDSRTAELIANYQSSGRKARNPNVLSFIGVEGDVYNPSAPFMYNGETYIMARHELREDEFSTKSSFFKNQKDIDGNTVWYHDTAVSNLENLLKGRISQDPSISYVQGNYVVSVVDVVLRDPLNQSAGSEYSSALYYGRTLKELQHLANSPMLMKGVRTIELNDGRVGVFTRPQNINSPEKGGLGKIGFTTVDKINDITTELLADAPLIDDIFGDNEWGGVNYPELLPDGKLVVLAHIARFALHDTITDFREYYPLLFYFDPQTRQISDKQLLGMHSDFDKSINSNIKRPDLQKVHYPAFFEYDGDTMRIGVGVSDTNIMTYEIDSPIKNR